MDKKHESGSLTLEALICVLLFVIMMITLASLFPMFMMKNASSHALMQAGEALSLDAYSLNKFGKDVHKAVTGSGGEDVTQIGSIGDILTGLIVPLFGSSEDSPNFVSDGKWYDVDAINPDYSKVIAAAKAMYIGYLAGSEDNAKAFIETMRVTNGLDGISFDGTKVEGGVLYINITYEIDWPFKIGLKPVTVTQSTCSKLWK